MKLPWASPHRGKGGRSSLEEGKIIGSSVNSKRRVTPTSLGRLDYCSLIYINCNKLPSYSMKTNNVI